MFEYEVQLLHPTCIVGLNKVCFSLPDPPIYTRINLSYNLNTICTDFGTYNIVTEQRNELKTVATGQASYIGHPQIFILLLWLSLSLLRSRLNITICIERTYDKGDIIPLYFYLSRHESAGKFALKLLFKMLCNTIVRQSHWCASTTGWAIHTFLKTTAE